MGSSREWDDSIEGMRHQMSHGVDVQELYGFEDDEMEEMFGSSDKEELKITSRSFDSVDWMEF